MNLGNVEFLVGDVFDCLAELPDEYFDCVVTSPPYWGLRDYGVDGQIGLEPTLGEHIDVLVRVFAEIHRVLKKTGTVWLNYGDCYATSPNGRSAADTKATGNDDRTFRDKPFSTAGPVFDPTYEKSDHLGRVVAGGVIKAKNLCMAPNRLAIALQEWGWWVRSEIIWGKKNPMPESVKDRPATSHEKIFLLTKAPRYFYNADAVRQGAAKSSIQRWSQDIDRQEGSSRANGGMKSNGPMKAVGGPRTDKQRGHSRRHAGFNDRWDAMPKAEQQDNGRNLRNYEPAPVQVWPIATKPFSDAHFATFPPELVERCLDAGCPPDGRALDPFGGSGTVGMVAKVRGIDSTLIELNPEYVEIAKRRIDAADPSELFRMKAANTSVSDLPMFSKLEG